MEHNMMLERDCMNILTRGTDLKRPNACQLNNMDLVKQSEKRQIIMKKWCTRVL
jgi:copper homeostasis protein CutC